MGKEFEWEGGWWLLAIKMKNMMQKAGWKGKTKPLLCKGGEEEAGTVPERVSSNRPVWLNSLH